MWNKLGLKTLWWLGCESEACGADWATCSLCVFLVLWLGMELFLLKHFHWSIGGNNVECGQKCHCGSVLWLHNPHLRERDTSSKQRSWDACVEFILVSYSNFPHHPFSLGFLAARTAFLLLPDVPLGVRIWREFYVRIYFMPTGGRVLTFTYTAVRWNMYDSLGLAHVYCIQRDKIRFDTVAVWNKLGSKLFAYTCTRWRAP